MRFAYIDSQDREVAVPSVDALRLRIQAGDVAAETMLYDAEGRGWAPAAEHEPFRALHEELALGEAVAAAQPPGGTATATAGQPTPRSGPARVLSALLLLLLVSGGWLGWSVFHGRGDSVPAPRYTPVEIPALDPGLEPAFREVSAVALQGLVNQMAELQARAGLPPAPPLDWLSGRYLANASRYPEVAAYWAAMSEVLGDLRPAEEDVFGEALEARIRDSALGVEERSLVRERALAGFRSAQPDRDVAWDALADVIRTALELHGFLVQNEADIDYEPVSAGRSGDPLLETAPRSPQLADALSESVDRVARALDAMGALGEALTTERLFALTFEGLAGAGVH